jgi:hypothetical protein
MPLDKEDVKVLGGIGGAMGGAVTGAQAAALIAPFTGPFAPFVILGGIIFGGSAGASTGYRNPASGALLSLGMVSEIPVPPSDTAS